jgi:hypothetical protein
MSANITQTIRAAEHGGCAGERISPHSRMQLHLVRCGQLIHTVNNILRILRRICLGAISPTGYSCKRSRSGATTWTLLHGVLGARMCAGFERGEVTVLLQQGVGGGACHVVMTHLLHDVNSGRRSLPGRCQTRANRCCRALTSSHDELTCGIETNFGL